MEYPAQFEFSSGVRVSLVEMRQTAHYEGLLEGLPTREMNAAFLARLRSARPELHVLPPLETAIEWSGPRAYPFGTPATLPPVLCEARFRASDDGLHVREASVAWFQSTWAFPVEPAALGSLQALDWRTVSVRREL